MGSASSLGVGILFRRTSGRARALLFAVLALGIAGRLLVVGTAVLVARGRAYDASAAGVASAMVFALLRVVQVFARVTVQRDVYAMTAHAVLASDVLRVPTADVRRVVLDGTYHSVLLVSALVPALMADLASSIAIAPFIVTTFSGRVLVLVGIAVPTVTIATVLLRGITRRLEQRAIDAWDRVIDRLLVAVENRLELVARAGEDEFRESFERQLDEYASIVRRSNLLTALLGRAPLAAGALAVGLVVAVDNASREALAGAILSQAIILAACFPPIHGALLGMHGMVRSLVFARPLMVLLSEPHRKDVADPGKLVVKLPADVRGEAISFAYDDKRVISDLSFEWSKGEPLVLVGPNGSGKSTLLKLLLGLRPPGSGSLRYASHSLDSIDVRALRRDIAYLPQRPYLGESYGSVRDAMHLSVPGVNDDAVREALSRAGVLAALSENVPGELDTRIGQLSAGQRQRVALARLLLQDARMVLLDEPDANLDREGIALVAALVKELSSRGKMVAVAAHTRELADLSPRRVELD